MTIIACTETIRGSYISPTELASLLTIQLEASSGASNTAWVDRKGRASLGGGGGALYTAQESTFNNQPVEAFNGTTHKLIKTNFTAIPQPFTVFMVAACTSTSGTFFDKESASTGGRIILQYLSGNTIRMFAGTVLDSTSTTLTGPSVLTGTYNGAASNLWVNGVLKKTGDAGSQSLESFTVGCDIGATFLQGKIGALYVVAGAISDATRVRIQRTLGRRNKIATT